MITRLLTGALVFVVSACALPAAPAPEAAAWPCSAQVLEAAAHANGLAKHRDDQRAVMLFPAGPAMAAYEAETAKLREDAARLLAELNAHDPDAGSLPPPPAINPATLTAERVAGEIAAAEACIAGAGK